MCQLLSQHYQQVFGECVNFSPNIINKFTDNQVCKEITANQVKVWPKKGKLFVKYAILNWIGAVMSKTASVRFYRSSKNRVSFRQGVMNLINF